VTVPAQQAAPAPPVLEVEELTASYGPFRALFGVSFVVPAGGAVALLGPNGAGKSTVVRVLTGLVPATGGRVVIDGRDVTGWPAWKIARLGVTHAPEGRSVLGTLTVEENLSLAFRRALGRHGATEAVERAYTAFPRLRERRRQAAGTLSGGEQRMLSLARVLADPPRLLVVDELSLGLAPRVVDDVFATLAEIRSAGTALLVVEQHVTRALALADDAVLLAKGVVTHAGRAQDMVAYARTITGAGPA
jgi:branched-chain amino acid transport system ATP-binding protein